MRQTWTGQSGFIGHAAAWRTPEKRIPEVTYIPTYVFIQLNTLGKRFKGLSPRGRRLISGHFLCIHRKSVCFLYDLTTRVTHVMWRRTREKPVVGGDRNCGAGGSRDGRTGTRNLARDYLYVTQNLWTYTISCEKVMKWNLEVPVSDSGKLAVTLTRCVILSVWNPNLLTEKRS